MKKLNNIIFGGWSRFTTVISAALIAPTISYAQGFADLASNLRTQMGSMFQIATLGFALLGIFFVGTGLMRLKAAVDSQGQQVKYSEGIWRLGLGGLLIAVPVITGIGNQTLLGADSSGAAAPVNSLFQSGGGATQ